MSDDYRDIIKNPHHTSKTRKRMSAKNRAAQFAPFAALSGYEASVIEAARITQNQAMLDDKMTETLNLKLNLLKSHLNKQPVISVTYFVPDDKKTGGAYKEYNGKIRTVDELSKTLIMVDKTTILIDKIYDIKGEIFNFINYSV